MIATTVIAYQGGLNVVRFMVYSLQQIDIYGRRQEVFEGIFRYKRAVYEKLEDFGFDKVHNAYQYDTDILDGEFHLRVIIGKNSIPDTKLMEKSTDEEYTLYKTNASGEYVGSIRTSIAVVLQNIADQCYETTIFKSEQSMKLIAYVRTKYGDELEYLWEKFPDNAVWRRKDNKKWYGILLTVSRHKLGIQSYETVEILDLRSKPEDLQNLIDHERYYPGWHMNKKHWYTIILDGSVSMEQICCKIDESYLLAK